MRLDLWHTDDKECILTYGILAIKNAYGVPVIKKARVGLCITLQLIFDLCIA